MPVFVRYCREYTVMNTADFGSVTQIEVGALMVGKIRNHYGVSSFTRGEEKGLFLYGGSTIVILLEPGQAVPYEHFFENTERGIETPAHSGRTFAALQFPPAILPTAPVP